MRYAIGGWRAFGLSAMLVLLVGTIAVRAQDIAMAPPDPIEGVWQTLLLSEVTIAPCEAGFCGMLSKIVVPTEGLTEEEIAAANAMPVESFTDLRNPDESLRSRPMLGLQILTLRYGDKPGVYDGEIYNPQDGNTYSGYVEMVTADQLKLNGCVLYNIICQGEDWVRVIPEPVPATQ